MKYILYGVAATLGVMLALMGVSPVQGGMMGQGQMRQPGEAREPSPGGMMGQEGMGGMGIMMPQMMQQMMRSMMGGGMHGMPEGMGMPQPSRLVRMLKEELGLSDEQTKQLKPIVLQAMKTEIQQRADLQIAEIDLGELLEAAPVDMAQVEAKLKGIEGLRTMLRLTLIKAHEQAKALLTPEQRQKLERLHDRMPGMMGSGPMGMMEMMGEGSAGAMSMRGPGMMGMIGGGMGGQSQSAPQMAGMPQNLTQQDTQGAVTVSATLLTPDKTREDGKLAVQVKLDTHAVDLDQYQIEKLAALRDGLGREIPAAGLESASGSGHHREGVLTFPGADASGKPVLSPEAKTLTLIMRGIGGVPERMFRWQLPLG
jgi:Spy/CpxP family protein refolding chaperone